MDADNQQETALSSIRNFVDFKRQKSEWKNYREGSSTTVRAAENTFRKIQSDLYGDIES